MNPFAYILLAVDTIYTNKIRSVLTMLGVIIGVTAVILLISLGEAAQLYVEGRFVGLGSNLLSITPGKQETSGMAPMMAGSFRKITNRDAKEIRRRAQGVTGVAPFVLGTGTVRYAKLQRDVMVFGLTKDFSSVRDIDVHIGRFIEDRDNDKNSAVCVIGQIVKKELFGNRNALHEKISINQRKFVVVGVLEQRGVSIAVDMDDAVFIPLVASQYMFYGGEDRVYQIYVSTGNPEDIDVAMESIREILISTHDYTEDFTIVDQASIIQSFTRIFNALKAMLGGLASISLIVGGVGIMNIMLVSVRERTREVGIRKAVGARRQDIGIQFLFEAIILSTAGGAAGVLLAFSGTFISRIVYPDFPVYCSTWSVLLAFSFSVTIGVFFGVYPALKASSVDPVVALRYE